VLTVPVGCRLDSTGGLAAGVAQVAAVGRRVGPQAGLLDGLDDPVERHGRAEARLALDDVSDSDGECCVVHIEIVTDFRSRFNGGGETRFRMVG